MKIPHLAVLFIIIIVPVTLVLTLYINYQSKTVSLKSSYDAKVMGATKDAIEAFELNTFGDLTSSNAVSTRRNVHASVNLFLDSLASNFGSAGYDNSDLLAYVPALLFTMYDGYYIYAPNPENQTENINDHVLKPYTYYSARYKKDDEYDVVINYSLDNYITITGTVNGQYVSKSGYYEDVGTKGTRLSLR